MAKTVGAAWRAVRDRLRASGNDNAALDARLLAAEAFGLDSAGLIAREFEIATDTAVDRLNALARRRSGGEPIARILGRQEFHGLQFAIDRATLVPRPETELLVDLAVEALSARDEPRILDLGTGSGCIAISILFQIRNATAVGVDIARDALSVARSNAARHGVADRLDLRAGNWFEAVGPDEFFDLIVSNPPYIESSEIPRLEPEVREHDPLAALDGGADGLDAYRIIVGRAASHLRPDGVLLLEVGASQAEAVAGLAKSAGHDNVGVHKDIAGHDRAISAKR